MKSFLTLVTLGTLIVSSCQKEVLDHEPQASLPAETAIKDAPSVTASLLGIYSGLQSGNYYGLRYQAMADLYTDNLRQTGTFPSWGQIANKAILPDNVESTNMWNSIYSVINRANTVIAAVPNIADPTLDKDLALAEARTLRALAYFDLMRYWGGSTSGFNGNGGGVPLKLTPTLTEADAAPLARATEAAVFTQINADLDFAISVASFPNIRSIPSRVTKDFAKALKARVALYTKDYVTAETLATELISSNRYSLMPGATYTNLWVNKNTTEALFELQFEPTNSNSIAFFYYRTISGGRNEIKSTHLGAGNLRDAHEANDVRRNVNASTQGGNTSNFTTLKYTRVATGDDNVIIYRLAELFLIRAEARALKANPDLVGSLADLNVIRLRAGISASNANTATALMDAIIQERRVELAHEGHRFFDLRRTNRLGTTSSLGASFTGNNTFRALWPIPQRETLNSGGVITQNTGY